MQVLKIFVYKFGNFKIDEDLEAIIKTVTFFINKTRHIYWYIYILNLPLRVQSRNTELTIYWHLLFLVSFWPNCKRIGLLLHATWPGKLCWKIKILY